MPDNVCRECHRIVKKSQMCAYCNSTAVTNDWSGYVVIIDSGKSHIAKKIGVKLPGEYALKVR